MLKNSQVTTFRIYDKTTAFGVVGDVSKTDTFLKQSHNTWSQIHRHQSLVTCLYLLDKDRLTRVFAEQPARLLPTT
jgi:hypothetical protein